MSSLLGVGHLPRAPGCVERELSELWRQTVSRSVRCSSGALKNNAQESGLESARKIAFYIERGFSKLMFKHGP